MASEKFKSACEQIRKFSKRPPENDMLEIYALYKQATIGDINIAKPVTADDTAKLKWDAWNGKKGITQSTAMERYTLKVSDLAKSFA